MKIAIHRRKNSFSEDWLPYCDALGIETQIVDSYSSNIVRQLHDCDALMWHFHHASRRDVLFSKQLIYSLETSGKVLFPDVNTCWFFDDKVAQKYLLEEIGAPFVPAQIFYDKISARDWIETASFPKVFKLRHGAGSSNVQLARSKQEAFALAGRAFGRGFQQYRAASSLRDRWMKYRLGLTGFNDVVKGILRFGYTTDFNRVINRERGYVYFQDYIPDKTFDLRVIVIGDKAFGIKRNTRPNDFRASGSGLVEYGREHFSDAIIRQSFDLAKKIKSKALSIDYVCDQRPMIVEINFGFSSEVYRSCPGYWDRQLNWYDGPFNPSHWMVDGVIHEIEEHRFTPSK